MIQLQPLRPTGDLWGPLGPFGLVWAGQGPSGAVGSSLGPSGAADFTCGVKSQRKKSASHAGDTCGASGSARPTPRMREHTRWGFEAGSAACLSWISRMPKLDQPHAAEALTGPSHHLLAFSVFRSRTNRHPGHFVIRQMANSNLSLSMWMAASVMRWTEPPA